MKLVEVNWQPSNRQLRQFGLISLFALPLIAWLWSNGNLTAVAICGGIGVSLAVIGAILPRAIKPIFIALCVVAIPIGLVVGELATLLVFYGLLLPIGSFFRLIKRDALQLKIDREAASYWQPKKQPSGPASYFRQS